jgi:hypothetical protein
MGNRQNATGIAGRRLLSETVYQPGVAAARSVDWSVLEAATARVLCVVVFAAMPTVAAKLFP